MLFLGFRAYSHWKRGADPSVPVINIIQKNEAKNHASFFRAPRLGETQVFEDLPPEKRDGLARASLGYVKRTCACLGTCAVVGWPPEPGKRPLRDYFHCGVIIEGCPLWCDH